VGGARADYDSDQSRWMEFRFGAPDGQAPGAPAPQPGIDGVGAGDLLGMARELAEALGADPPADSPGWLRAAMDDLRVAAKYRMLDLEAARREAAERQ